MFCELCKKNPAEHAHHRFSQSKVNRKLYGKLIDHPLNIIFLCSICHLNKAIPKWDEREFCNVLGLQPLSKILTRKKN